MRRKLSLLVMFVGVLGLLGLNPAAQADHYNAKKTGTDTSHDAEPMSKLETAITSASERAGDGQCAVAGEVSINEGVNDTPKHNHYRFNDTQIICQVNPVGGLPARFSGTYEVQAAGGTDGPGNQVNTTHGEDDARGWSHKSCYVGFHTAGCDSLNAKDSSVADIYDGSHRNPVGSTDCWNCGEIAVDDTVDAHSCLSGGTVASPCHNVVIFDRVGSTVFAWGELHEDGATGVIMCFLAELEFVPTNSDLNSGIDQATLIGGAQIWNEDDAPCGVAGSKAKK